MKALIRHQCQNCTYFTEDAFISGELKKGQCNVLEEWEKMYNLRGRKSASLHIIEGRSDKLSTGCSPLSHMLTSCFVLCTDKHSNERHRQNDLPSTDAWFLLIESHDHRWSRQSLVKGSLQRQYNLIEWLSRSIVFQWGVSRKKTTMERHQSCWPR